MSETAPAFERAEWCAFLNRMLEADSLIPVKGVEIENCL